MRYRFPVLLYMLILTGGLLSFLSAQSCIDFLTPVTGGSIITPSCTLLIEEENCSRNIRKIEFQARYFPAGSDTATVISIGSVSRPPFSIIWDLSNIPNQLFSGASFFAEATLSNGENESVRREGVFFIHKKVDRPIYEVSYDFSGTKRINAEPMHLPAPRSDITIDASIYWNKDELVFIVNVADPQFSTKLPREQLASLGIEILLDPSLSRKPFPGKDVFIYSVPLNGKPYRIDYKPIPNDSGSFTFSTSTMPCDFEATIAKMERKGFTILCPIPVAIFGPDLPEVIGCNLVAKTVADNKEVKRTSWIRASLYETYSPYLWGELRLNPQPIFMNRPLVGGLAFGFGFLITLLIAAVIMILTKPTIKNIVIQSEAEKQQFAAIKEVLDSKVTTSDVTLDACAKELNYSEKKVSLLIRRATGMNFQTYVMYERIEIAKERLRSSHCTGDSIAKACGFHSLSEMEKYFIRFHHITPAKFRTEQQVV